LTIDDKKFTEQAEHDLYKAIQSFIVRRPHLHLAQVQVSSVDEFLNIVVKLIPSINDFFEKVLVMAEDKAVKENRLGLLQRIASLAHGVADLSKLEGF
jgi:glycyl-tRNA synthetase beta subunit